MSLDPVEVLGLVAACFTTGAYLPQVWRTWKTRSVEDISLWMFSSMVFGILLWIVYGVLAGSIPVLVSSCTSLLLTGAILVMRIRFRKPKV